MSKLLDTPHEFNITLPENYIRGNSDNWYNPIPRTCLWNVDIDSDLMKRSTRLPWDWICLTSVFWCSYYWCEKKNLGAICLVLSPLMFLFFIWSMQAALFSWRVVSTSLIEDNILVLRIYSIMAGYQELVYLTQFYFLLSFSLVALENTKNRLGSYFFLFCEKSLYSLILNLSPHKIEVHLLPMLRSDGN